MIKKTSLLEQYPALCRWVQEFGHIEIGYIDFTDSFIRIINDGGTFWENKIEYKSIEDALRAANRAAKFFIENGMHIFAEDTDIVDM